MKLKMRLTALGLAICLWATGPGVVEVCAQTSKEDLQNAADAAKEEYENASGKLEEANAALGQAADEKNSLAGKKQQVLNQLGAVYNQVQAQQTALEEAQAQADEAAQQLEQAQKNYDERLQNSKSQLEAMQELHDGGNVFLLSQLTNLYEFLTFGEVLQEMSDKNAQVLGELNEEARALAEQKQQAEDTAASLQASKEALLSTQSQLKQTQEQLASSLMEADAALDEKEAEAQAAQAVTDESKKAYEQALAQLDAYVASQSQQYTPTDLECEGDFGRALDSYTAITCRYLEPDWQGVPHHGTDFSAPAGTPIHAVAAGVVSVSTYHSSYGNYVQISHGTAADGNTYDSLYAHMSSATVSAGQRVEQGEVIGYVGSTGDSSGNHLHLEMRVNGSRIDALSVVPA